MARIQVWVAGALAVLLWGLPLRGATRFALFVGNNIGNIDDGALRWAESDAQRVYQLFVDLGAVAKGRAILLQGRTVGEIRNGLARLRGQVEEAHRNGHRTEVLFYYSGHGDKSSLHLGAEQLTVVELQQLVRDIPADTAVTILDACRAGNRRDKGAVHGLPFDISLTRDVGPAGRVVITSAGADEIAQESDDLEGSFFTHHLLSGLRGSADSNGDGQVTLGEIYSYAYNRTLSGSHGQTAAVQHPEMQVSLAGEGELVMTVLNRARSAIVLPGAIDGDLLVVDDRDGRVVAEVRKTGGDVRTLAVPVGRYRIQLRRGGRVYAGEISLEWGGRKEVSEADLTEQPLFVALAKGSKLDPYAWTMLAAYLAATPVALGAGTSQGGRLVLERHLAESGAVLLLTFQLSGASEGNDIRRYRHLESAILGGVGYELYAGPLAFMPYLSLGAVLVAEKATPSTGQLPAASESYAAGPCLHPGLSIRAPLGISWALTFGLEFQAATVKVSEQWKLTTGWLGYGGVAYVF